MLRDVRESLEAYASGMGVPAAQVIREFKKLPEADEFRVLSNIRKLEKMHKDWVANGGKPPAPNLREAEAEMVTRESPVEPTTDELQRAADHAMPLRRPPEEESARAAREARATFLRMGRNPLASGLVDRNGRPLRRD